jgi:tetratricopeptide (TPR) repeat protein
MTLALTDEPDVAGLPAAAPARPASMETVTPLREALGLSHDSEPAHVLQAQWLADEHPRSAIALVRLAQAALSVGDEDRACAAARAAIAALDSKQGTAPYVRHAAALVLAAAGATDAADALAEDRQPGAAVIRAGLAFEADADETAALRMLDGESGPLAQSMRGWLLLEDKPGEAVAALRAAARNGLRSTDVLVNLGYGLASLGATDKAVRVTREATVLSPSDLNAAYNLSVYLSRQGRTQEALAELDRIAQARPHDPELALRRAWGHVHLANDVPTALRHLRDARERLRFKGEVTARAEVETSIAYLEFKIGRKTKTAAKSALWQRLPASGPGREVTRMLASLLGDPGDGPELARLLREAGHTLTSEQRLVQESRLAVLENQVEEAVSLAMQAVDTAGDDPEVMGYAMFVIGETAGRYQEAAALVDRFDGPLDPRVANNIALALALAGKAQQAEKVVARAGGAAALPYEGATAALVELAAGRTASGLRGYEEAVRRVRDKGDAELADLIDWRRRLAMLQLGLPPLENEDAEEPPGTGHPSARDLLRRVRARLHSES